MPAGADNVTCPPSQNVVGPEGVRVAVAGVFTTTGIGAEVATQPVASVTSTVSVSVAEMITDCVVAPLDQSHDAPLFALRVTLPGPQKVVGPDGVMLAAGVETLTVNVVVAVGQLVTKTSTLMLSGSAVPASKVMLVPLVGEVMVPLLAITVQA